MPYPNSPNLTPIWSLPKQYTATIVKNDYGGIIDRGDGLQINAIAHTYQVKCFIRDFSLFQSTKNFFNSRRGRPFVFQSVQYHCLEQRWTCEWNLWTFEAVFEECQNPN